LALLHGLSGISHAAGASDLGTLARSLHDRLRKNPDNKLQSEDISHLQSAAGIARNAIKEEINKI
jgi:L-serine deaminase